MSVSEAKTARPAELPDNFSELPRLVQLDLMAGLSAAELAPLCRLNRRFALTVCGQGTTTTSQVDGATLHGIYAGGELVDTVDDKDVVPDIWQNFLRRDYGIAVLANECSAFSEWERELVAKSLREYLRGHEADNLARLRRFRHLYTRLYGLSLGEVLLPEFERRETFSFREYARIVFARQLLDPVDKLMLLLTYRADRFEDGVLFLPNIGYTTVMSTVDAIRTVESLEKRELETRLYQATFQNIANFRGIGAPYGRVLCQLSFEIIVSNVGVYTGFKQGFQTQRAVYQSPPVGARDFAQVGDVPDFARDIYVDPRVPEEVYIIYADKGWNLLKYARTTTSSTPIEPLRAETDIQLMTSDFRADLFMGSGSSRPALIYISRRDSRGQDATVVYQLPFGRTVAIKAFFFPVLKNALDSSAARFGAAYVQILMPSPGFFYVFVVELGDVGQTSPLALLFRLPYRSYSNLLVNRVGQSGLVFNLENGRTVFDWRTGESFFISTRLADRVRMRRPVRNGLCSDCLWFRPHAIAFARLANDSKTALERIPAMVLRPEAR